MATKNWIAGAISHPGAFSAQAMRAHMTTVQFAQDVLKKNSTASPKTKARARLALKLRRLNPNIGSGTQT